MRQLLSIRNVCPEPQADRQEAGCLSRFAQCVAVGRAHDYRKRIQGWILKLIDLQKCIEAAERPLVGKFHARYIEGDRVLLARHLQYFSRRHVEDLAVCVDEAPYQSRAGESIDLGALPGNPFHKGSY